MQRIVVALLCWFSFVMPAFAMEHRSDVLQDPKGNIIGQATVTVYLSGTTTLAALFSDNGVTAKANPFKSNTFDGTYDFYAANGVYDIAFSKPGVTFNNLLTKRVSLFDLNDGLGGTSVSSAFNAITSGTNITAAMILGSGSSLTFTGGGVNNASQYRGNAVVASLDGGTGFSVPVDDTTLVGNGSIWQEKALPSCNNPTTSKLLYDTGANTFSCGVDQTAGGGTTFDQVGSGTNSSSTMTVNSGASVLVTGTGIVASSTFSPNLVTVNAGNSPYTALTSNATILCDTTLASRIINLPAATAHVFLTFFNMGSNTCTINRGGADTITTGVTPGQTSFILRNPGSTFWLQPDGISQWYVGG